MQSTEAFIAAIAPEIYREVNDHLRAPFYTDQSHGSSCDQLTILALDCFNARKEEVRREWHKDNAGNWHYLIVHEPVLAVPSMSDVVTDLNPWQYTTNRQLSGPLHMTREALMTTLREHEAPAFFVALRGLSTIYQSHKPRH